MSSNLAAITIDPKDGSVWLEGTDVSIVRGMDLSEVKRSFSFGISHERDLGNGYHWIGFGSLMFEGKPAGLSMCFNHQKLEMVSLGVTLPDDKEIEGWPSEESSLRQVKFICTGLERQLGCKLINGVAQFSWGSAWSLFDPRGFMATAGLNYK